MTDESGRNHAAAAPIDPPDPAQIADQAAQLLQGLREHSPLVHNITNHVATNFSANALLAVGAAPAMVDTAEEAGVFAPIASALLINLGTLSHQQLDAGRAAVAAANEADTPWVLDPVAIGALPLRTAFAAELLEAGPTAVRGNASEIIALAGAGTGGRGVDSADDTDAATPAAVGLARDHAMVVAVSGAEDLITDGQVEVRVRGGHPLLTQVTGAGCALGSIIAAMLGARTEAGGPADADTLTAVTAAHIVYGIAAEKAADGAQGPGTFLPRFLDALAAVTPQEVAERARIRVAPATVPAGRGN